MSRSSRQLLATLAPEAGQQKRSEGARPLRGPISCVRSKGRRQSAALSRKVVTVLFVLFSLIAAPALAYQRQADEALVWTAVEVEPGASLVGLPVLHPDADADHSRVPAVARRPHPTVPPYVRPVVVLPANPVRVVHVGAVGGSGGHAVSGVASWFCGHGSACTHGYPAGGLYAAAGPALRVGDWRGRQVDVSVAGRHVLVRLVDWCACPQRALDLYRAAFSRLADPSRGLVKVSVTW